MSVYGIIFYFLSAIVVVSTGLAITRKNQVHAVVFLVISFFGTALLFFLLGAPFLAALEVIIYAGAIMVLFLFIIMTLHTEELRPSARKKFIPRWTFPLVSGAVALAVAELLLFKDPSSRTGLKPAMVSPMSFGCFLFENYWFPVEIVSFLLFVGLVGALYLGRGDEKSVSPYPAAGGGKQVAIDQKRDGA